MVDVVDVVPAAIDVKGTLVVWWVDSLADPTAPKAATEIGATGSARLTHSFTPTGFALDGDQTVDTDERLGLREALESLGILTNTLGMLEYVDSTDPKSAAVVLKPTAPADSKSGWFVIRRNVSNKVLATAAQKTISIPTTLGPQIFPVNPDGKHRIKQRATITGPIIHGVMAA